jgi:hypothetical protein
MKPMQLVEDLETLTNSELIEYKNRLYEHGAEVEQYILDLREHWHTITAALKDRLFEIELELLVLHEEREHEDYLEGSGGDSLKYIN